KCRRARSPSSAAPPRARCRTIRFMQARLADLRALLEHASEAMALHDGERFLYANPAMHRCSGCEDGALIGLSLTAWLRLCAGSEAASCRAWLLAEITPAIVELTRPDGTAIAFEGRAHKMSVDDLAVTAVYLRDREQAFETESLRRSAENFRTL